MPRHIRLILIAAIASLAIVPTASADRWHGGNWDNNYPQQDPNWDPGSGWNDQPATDAPATDAPSPGVPQGDPQETPSVWNNTPPVDPQWNGNQNQQRPDRNPWSNIPALPVSKTPTVSGKTAMIRRNGLAAIPKGAPAKVRAIISAANTIIGKPYKWGGGHGRLFDTGYDCSGSVSYALIRAGLLGYPMVSGTLAHWGAKGLGRYVTIYANKSHVYMEVAGLRLDTSSVGDPKGKSGVRWRPPIGKRFGFAVRHVSGL